MGCDPDVKFQEISGKSLLESVCLEECNDSDIGAGLELIEAIHDAHPEFIRKKDVEGNLPLHIVCLRKNPMEKQHVSF